MELGQTRVRLKLDRALAKNMKLSRKKFLLAAAAGSVSAIAGASYMRHFEPDWFEVTRKQVKLRGLQEPIRLVHLSDFHASEDVPYSLIEQAIDLALEQGADLACLTGDFITSTLNEPSEYRRILTKLSSAMPTFACIGNHDGGSWAGRTYGYPTIDAIQALLVRSDIHLLFNRKTTLQIGRQELQIAGLGDLWAKDLHPERVLETSPQQDTPLVLLSHNPDCFELLDGYSWDLMLCGHTHGGQLVIPILGSRPFLPVRHTQYAEGLHFWKDHQIHVTRGVGNLHGMRFNCRPEISVLELSPA